MTGIATYSGNYFYRAEIINLDRTLNYETLICADTLRTLKPESTYHKLFEVYDRFL